MSAQKRLRRRHDALALKSKKKKKLETPKAPEVTEAVTETPKAPEATDGE